MDPISQGSLGAVLPQSVLTSKRLGYLTFCGAVAGLAPDLDVFITSSTDPLVFLQYHRQFTHALVFIPFGALVVAGILFPFLPGALRFKHVYLACFLGYATHGLLDACTSYGTQLFWPFTDYRVSWNLVSVIDPAFTVPLLLLVIAGLIWRRRWLPVLALVWVFLYLSLGVVQSQRALSTAEQLAMTRGHVPKRLTIKPSFANQLVWRSIYEYNDIFYIDAIRVGLSLSGTHCGKGVSVPVLNIENQLPWLSESQQLTDVERFSWFSQDYVAITPDTPNRIVDVRYSTVPNQIEPLWAIDLDPRKNDSEHVEYRNLQRVDDNQIEEFTAYLTGVACTTVQLHKPG